MLVYFSKTTVARTSIKSLSAEVGVVTGQPVGHLTNGIVVVPGVHELPDTDQEGTQVGVVGLVVQGRVRNVGLGPSHGRSNASRGNSKKGYVRSRCSDRAMP